MFSSLHRPPRPRLTARILFFALIDVFGLCCVSMGIGWFAAGRGVLLANFPTSTAEAVASLAGGAAIMIWAVARIQREVAEQGTELQARYDAYIAAHHPDKLRPRQD